MPDLLVHPLSLGRRHVLRDPIPARQTSKPELNSGAGLSVYALLDLAPRQELSVGVVGGDGVQDGPAAALGRACHHGPGRGEREPRPTAGVAREARLAEARVDHVDGDAGVLDGEVFAELAERINLDELGDGVSGRACISWCSG